MAFSRFYHFNPILQLGKTCMNIRRYVEGYWTTYRNESCLI